MLDFAGQFNIWAIVDILIIAYIVYHGLMLIRGTRAAQILTGILIVLVAFLLSSIFQLTTLNWVINKFYSSFIIIIIVLFQDDIRHALSRIGKKSLISGNESISSNHLIDEVSRAAIELADRRIGALIVFERSIILSRYVNIGVWVDARVSKEVLISTFHPSSPIHDGAIIIQNGRISSAGSFLPLTRAETLDSDMGTRHRAAFGISQETDAVVVLVSEEKGAASVVVEGNIEKNLDLQKLRKTLKRVLIEQPDYLSKTNVKPAQRKVERRQKDQNIFSKMLNPWKK